MQNARFWEALAQVDAFILEAGGRGGMDCKLKNLTKADKESEKHLTRPCHPVCRQGAADLRRFAIPAAAASSLF